jgi:hypothetical protein
MNFLVKKGQSVRNYCEQNPEYFLLVCDVEVVFAPDDADDVSQHWIKVEIWPHSQLAKIIVQAVHIGNILLEIDALNALPCVNPTSLVWVLGDPTVPKSCKEIGQPIDIE